MNSEIDPFPSPRSFPFAEADMATRTGLRRQNLEDARKLFLVEGRDFIREKRHICLSYDAAARVLAHQGLPADDVERLLGVVPSISEKNDATHGLALLAVYAKRVLNPKIMLVTDGKTVFRLRVQSKKNFTAGMMVRCRHLSADLYEMVGNAPRFPGKF